MRFFSWLKPKERSLSRAKPVQRVLSYQCASLQGVGTRERQEDAYELLNAGDVTRIRDMGLLALVADGMGGMQNGSLASNMAIGLITADYELMDRNQPLEPQLAGSIDHACEEVYGELKGMGGSTVVACLLYDEKLYYAGAGDSFLYLLRQGRLIRLNRAHTLKNQRYLELINADCMDPTSARTMAEAHAVTQFLGVDVLDDVDWFRRAMPLEDGDTLLLCSDGIAGVLSESQLAEYLNLENINDSCARMKQAILEKNLDHQDNFTGIVIRCKK